MIINTTFGCKKQLRDGTYNLRQAAFLRISWYPSFFYFRSFTIQNRKILFKIIYIFVICSFKVKFKLQTCNFVQCFVSDLRSCTLYIYITRTLYMYFSVIWQTYVQKCCILKWFQMQVYLACHRHRVAPPIHNDLLGPNFIVLLSGRFCAYFAISIS